MGRIIITNNSDWSDFLVNNNSDAGLKVCKYDEIHDIKLTSFYKLNVECNNYFECGDESVFVVGTFFYKELFGQEALEKLFHDRNQRSVKEIRADAFGAYAVLIKLKSKLIIFTDETRMYGLYYYADDNNFLITNSYLHIQQCTHQQIEHNALLERGIRGGIAGLNTPFKNIYSLSARQYIEINAETNEFIINPVELNNYGVPVSSADEAIKLLWNRTQRIAAIRSKYIHDYLQFVTGGIDSRLELAINIYNNDRIHLGYWMGSDLITNGTTEDLEIEMEIGERFSLKHDCYSVGCDFDEVLKAISENDIARYGEYASKYAGNKKWFSIFENAEEEFIGFGYFGETLRALGELDRHYHEDYSLDEFVKDVYCRTGLEKTIFSSDEFYSYLKGQMLNLLNVRSKAKYDIDDYYRVFTYSRFSADCLLTNICNIFAYSFPVFGVKQVADVIFSIPYQMRTNEVLSIGLTSRWCEGLLDVPYYSHHHKILCDKNSLMVRETKTNNLLGKIKPALINTKIYDYLYLSFLQKYMRPQQKNNKDVFDLCMKVLNNSAVFRNSSITVKNPNNWKGAELATLASFVADIRCIELINHQ
ncbi:hypothetical protein [[Clostridium] aminophilum]|uniref:Asparagine synthase n=1 Tax=[Clostridium] aminophilum TaxID=1526 RepID=A0A1I6K5P9_9FIRM|nr:hypothetical protein [[Clostridium] aminophilum]SFR86526.1 hypothetical protein SAMN02910262_02274 [[Clostridium] aminophilum]